MGRILGILSAALSIGVGLIVLIGLSTGALTDVSNALLQIAVTTAGFTVLIGVINLLLIHGRRIVARSSGALYSLALVLSFVLVIVLYVLGAEDARRALLQHVQVSIESALGALLLFALVYGAYRLMRRGVTRGTLLFTVVLLVLLVGAIPLAGTGLLGDLRAWLLSTLASAGARGLLIGIGLAALVAGMRALIGQERSFRE